MTARQVVTAPRYECFRGPVVRFIREWARAGQVLVIGAQRAAADEWARASCERALLGVHRTTLPQLAAALSLRAMAEAGATPVSRVVVEAVAARATAQALADRRLHYFEPVARTPGFAAALAGTLGGLRLDAVTPATLAEAGGPGADLAALLEIYTRELGERRLVDLAGQYRFAIAAARAGGHTFCGLPAVLVDVEYEAVLERALVDELAAQAPGWLEARLGPADFEVSTSLASLQRHLFSTGPIAERQADATVDLFAASGEALECVEIARRIGKAAEQGIPLDRMAVLLRAPERYQPMVEEGLRRAGLPPYFVRGSRRPYASGRAFLALLECAREGLSATRFAEYLSLGQMPDGKDEGEERHVAAPVQWERMLVDAAVVGGLDRWRRRLDGLAAHFRARQSAAEDEAERESAARQVDLVESLARFALPVVERLASLPQRATWAEWLDHLRTLALATLRRVEAVEELLDELQAMGDLGPAGLDDVLLVAAPRLRSLRVATEGPRYGKVFVASIEEARGMSFDAVFLPGLNEGTFPRPPREDPLLLDRFRERVPGARLHLRDDNQLLAIAAACARSRLVVSYSRLDLITGRQRVPSFYVFEALRAARGQSVDVRDIEREAERGAQTRIGWPAPSDPADAIDDAEFDLAVLRPAFDDPAAGRGAGAYLTRVNRNLVESLRTRHRRWSERWTHNDGLVIRDVHELQTLGNHRLAAKAYSASALQQFAVCPYRFALRAIFELHPAEREAGVERMDPILRGEVYHRTQFELLRELRTAALLPVTAQGLEDVIARLNRALQRVSEEFREKVAPAIPQVWDAEVEALRADLHGWLRQTASATDGWTPAWFELAFGLEVGEGHDPASVALPVAVFDGALLKGSIDLVERHPSGLLRVVDHKTGSAPAKAPQSVGGGESLQPVLYALAAEKVLGRSVSTGRLFYSTLRQNYRAVDIVTNDFTKHRARQVLETVDGAIRRGFLPAAPRQDACERCDYLAVCGPYEEERVRRKSQGDLKELKDLRRIP
jgi:ATP-dependent helicase/nuclease subunit B